MAHTCSIPPVTLEDLQSFQAKHFPNSRPAVPPPNHKQAHPNAPHKDGEPDAQDEGSDPDDLGYYPDGVKRTLTDEQIRIFRHSEIYALLRERQIQRENEEYERRVGGLDGDGDVQTGTGNGTGGDGEGEGVEERKEGNKDKAISASAPASPEKNDGDSDVKNAAFASPSASGTKRLADGAGSNEPVAKRKSKSKLNTPGDVYLDYNEPDQEESAPRRPSRGQAAQFVGRKIISYDD
ncbi:DUF3807 domain-containing protein [Aspergillus undulatus]|uniref:DUF3807 domain-containing protein n=1 Tax=Aspergillus undulatus TaxID=1810928 RepID=UPI003CCD9EFA